MTGMHVTMTTEKKNISNIAKHFPRNNDKYVVYVNAENKKLKENIPLQLQQF